MYRLQTFVCSSVAWRPKDLQKWRQRKALWPLVLGLCGSPLCWRGSDLGVKQAGLGVSVEWGAGCLAWLGRGGHPPSPARSPCRCCSGHCSRCPCLVESWHSATAGVLGGVQLLGEQVAEFEPQL